MQLEIIVEEQSAEEALKHLLPKMIDQRARWKVVNLGSKYKLLRELPKRLAAYQQRIKNGEKLRILVLIDRDNDNCVELKRKLEGMAKTAHLATKTVPDKQGNFSVVNRVVVEELESWFLGDPQALRLAFTSLPKIEQDKGIFRNPDNGGSWEALHRFLKKNGVYKSSYPKIDAARRIAPKMEVDRNRSKSFQVFVAGLHAILG